MARGEDADGVARRRSHRLGQRREASRLGETTDLERGPERLGDDIDQSNDLKFVREFHLSTQVLPCPASHTNRNDPQRLRAHRFRPGEAPAEQTGIVFIRTSALDRYLGNRNRQHAALVGRRVGGSDSLVNPHAPLPARRAAALRQDRRGRIDQS